MKRILIFNAEHRIALALCREFGRAGYAVDMASAASLPRSFYSKYCHKKIRHKGDALVDILSYIHDMRPDIILPVLDDSYFLAYKLADMGVSGIVTLPRYELFAALRDKETGMRFLRENGLRVPLTYSWEEFRDKYQDSTKERRGGLLLIKPRISSAGVGIVSFEGVEGFEDAYREYRKRTAAIKKSASYDFERPIVQEYIEGKTYLLSMMFDHGALCLKQLVHHTGLHIRDYGPFIRSRTVEINDAQIEGIIDFFTKLGWNGVVNVNLIRDQRGDCFINEVNPRFWGSYATTVMSGIKIADILSGILEGKRAPVAVPTNYDYECRSLLFGEFFYLLTTKHKLKALSEMLIRGDKKIYYGIDPGDIPPHLIHLVNLFISKEVL